jgi:2-(3-amino-3-carboxypropyl)histidine synthase
MELAQYLLSLAEKHDKLAQIFIMDLVSQDALDGYKIDAWVNTACPRVAIEDYLMFKKPILTPQEFEIVLGERQWKDYEMDEIKS